MPIGDFLILRSLERYAAKAADCTEDPEDTGNHLRLLFRAGGQMRSHVVRPYSCAQDVLPCDVVACSAAASRAHRLVSQCFQFRAQVRRSPWAGAAMGLADDCYFDLRLPVMSVLFLYVLYIEYAAAWGEPGRGAWTPTPSSMGSGRRVLFVCLLRDLHGLCRR